jgi:predicted aspartyl protease
VNGLVDESGRALLIVHLRPTADRPGSDLSVWIDTAFSGELVLSRAEIASRNLPQSSVVRAKLADGSQVLLESFSCVLDWFGGSRTVEVIANDGEFPLLGIGLLQDRRLVIDYPARTINME